MKNNKHSIAFYQKQKDKLEKTINDYAAIIEQEKEYLEAYIRTYYRECHSPEGYSKTVYDLMKYAQREMTRSEFLEKYNFLIKDNSAYMTLIQYAHNYMILDKLRKEYRTFKDNFKKVYPEGVLV